MIRKLGEPCSAEAQRIQQEYDRRARELPRDRYSWNHRENFYFHSETSRACIELLDSQGRFSFADQRLLDVGCGAGTWLLEFIQWGAAPENLCGVDLDGGRLATAAARIPQADLAVSDAANLPWPDASFDFVTQFTVFSSILDVELRKRIAGEMARVLKPGGTVLWFDFLFNNPRNRAVQGVTKDEVVKLFPDFDVVGRRVLLAPPLSRAIAPVSWVLTMLLGSIPILRTHYAAVLRKPSS